MRLKATILLGTAVMLLPAIPAAAQWPTSPDAPLYVAATDAEERNPIVCADGERGWFVAWDVTYWVSGTGVQRLDRFGSPRWGSSGVFIPNMTPMAIAATGDGDVLVALRRLGSESLFVQRLDLVGTPRWPQGPVFVQDSVRWEASFRQAPAGRTWLFALTSPPVGARVIGIPLDVDAAPMPGTGVEVIGHVRDGWGVRSAAAPNGDVFVVLNETPTGGLPYNLRVQKLSPDGGREWGSDGVVVSAEPLYSTWIGDVAPDPTGGAYVGYEKYTGACPCFAAVRRLRADGSQAWSPGERLVPSPRYGAQSFQTLVEGPASHAGVVWREAGEWASAFAHIDTSGLWFPPAASIFMTNPPAQVASDHIQASGFNDGAFVALWDDNDSTLMRRQIAQALGRDDERLWGSAGTILLRNSPRDLIDTHVFPALATGPRGDVLVAWFENREFLRNPDVFVSHADENGMLGVTLPKITSITDVPDDHGGVVRVRWAPSSLDEPGGSVFSYALAIESDADGGISEVVQIPAAGLASYEADCAGVHDSLGAFPARSKVRVIAHVEGGQPLWSPPDSAWAVDNLGAPVSVASRTAKDFGLLAVTPSPARSSVRIGWILPAGDVVRLMLLDLAGRRVLTLVDRWTAPGAHEENFELRDSEGRSLAPGLYLLSLSTGGQRSSRRLAIAR